MGHPVIVMRRIGYGQNGARATTIRTITMPHTTIAALAIRLRACASFQEKLRQLVGKCPAKRALTSALFEFHRCHIRSKF
jgi:hypothetical protein